MWAARICRGTAPDRRRGLRLQARRQRGGGPNRDWLTKVSETTAFVITGYIEREAVAVADLKNGVLVPAGLVKFGLAGRGLWARLVSLRAGPAPRSGIVPVRPELIAAVRHFGRYRTDCIRDGVLLAVS